MLYTLDSRLGITKFDAKEYANKLVLSLGAQTYLFVVFTAWIATDELDIRGFF